MFPKTAIAATAALIALPAALATETTTAAAANGAFQPPVRVSSNLGKPVSSLQVIVRSPGSAPLERHVFCPDWLPAHTASCRATRLVLRFTDEHPQRCLQIWGGPATADIRGVINGRLVRLHLTRTNSCEIARWEQLRFLLGSA